MFVVGVEMFVEGRCLVSADSIFTGGYNLRMDLKRSRQKGKSSADGSTIPSRSSSCSQLSPCAELSTDSVCVGRADDSQSAASWLRISVASVTGSAVEGLIVEGDAVEESGGFWPVAP